MERFTIRKNDYLSEHTLVYYHQPYLHYQEPGNPDFLNVLKNLINNEGQRRIDAARQEVYDIVPVSYTHLDVYKRQELFIAWRDLTR